jgi:bacterioferritin-associated ferredoxin
VCINNCIYLCKDTKLLKDKSREYIIEKMTQSPQQFKSEVVMLNDYCGACERSLVKILTEDREPCCIKITGIKNGGYKRPHDPKIKYICYECVEYNNTELADSVNETMRGLNSLKDLTRLKLTKAQEKLYKELKTNIFNGKTVW